MIEWPIVLIVVDTTGDGRSVAALAISSAVASECTVHRSLVINIGLFFGSSRRCRGWMFVLQSFTGQLQHVGELGIRVLLHRSLCDLHLVGCFAVLLLVHLGIGLSSMINLFGVIHCPRD